MHFLHGPRLSRRTAHRLARMVARLGAKISLIEVSDDRVDGLPTEGFTRTATWYKIFLPELVPDADRVLYLDSDVIALDSLSPVWDTALDDSYLAAVTNVSPAWFADRWSVLGLDAATDYFNAGVLLLNLDLMRSDRCSQAVHEFGVENASRLVLRDQDALNAVLARRRVTLHPRWNCMNALFLYPEADALLGASQAAEAKRRPAIRHFEGPDANKPWHYMCRQPHRGAYRRHRRGTPWPLHVPAGLTPGNIARRLS